MVAESPRPCSLPWQQVFVFSRLCVEAAAARGQWCGSGPLSQLSVQLCPSRLRGLLLYLLSCVGVQS